MKKPVERSRENLQKRGYAASVVERWNHFDKAYEQAFGFISLIATKPDEIGCTAIHITPVDPAIAATKLLADESAKSWLQVGNRIEIHEWYKDPDPEMNEK